MTVSDQPEAARQSAAGFLADLRAAIGELAGIEADGIAAMRSRTIENGRMVRRAMVREQRGTHALAWFATYRRALDELAGWLEHGSSTRSLSEAENLTARIAAGEFLLQALQSIVMSQGEHARPGDFGIDPDRLAAAFTPAVRRIVEAATMPAMRAALVASIEADNAPRHTGDIPDAPDIDEIRHQVRRFVDARIAPHAHKWHLANAYIPLDTISAMAELGFFGMTIAEEHGGLGLGKIAMCVVTEELSRGYIGAGSLGTRSEIAAELISTSGTDEQKRYWLPRIASGDVLVAAAFTEPDAGSDLASLRTSARRDGDFYLIDGVKTWITHAARADLFTLLVRTKASDPGHNGLSILLVEKQRGEAGCEFPTPGLSGREIEVLGYRGMKEFELSFLNFATPAASLLGEREGQGFRQLMRTFETARIQTAARAVGVAQAALELAVDYARQRRQFATPIIRFPRVGDKIALMSAEVLMARLLTYAAARQKDLRKRCDLEAGMAKLLAARTAWSAADNALQIHGGNGFSLDYPISRVLCDARILNIFEGAAEIQAEIIARRLLEDGDVSA